MAFRLVVMLFVCLAVASVAGAACLTCVGNGISDNGSCEPSSNGRCSYICCLSDPGTRCTVGEQTFGCSPDDPWLVPAAYFTTRLPLETQGSVLRLRLGKGTPVQRKCTPLMARRNVA